MISAPPPVPADAPLVLLIVNGPERNASLAEALAPLFQVAVTFDGPEGLEKAIALRPDLIVSDVMLPGMCGDELVSVVRRHGELDGTPIVLLTDEADDGLRPEMPPGGGVEYLARPFSVGEFLARVAGLIARRWRAEAASRKDHDLLRAVVEGITDPVFVKDARGCYLLMNAACVELTGKSVEEIIGADDTAVFGPEGAREFTENDRRVMEEGMPRRYEEAVAVAGVTRWFLATKVPYRDTDGRVIGVIGIARDITEQKRAEATLQESKTWFQAFMDHSPVIAFIKDSEGGWLHVNRAFLERLGFVKAGPADRIDAESFAPEVSRRLARFDAEVLATGRAADFEERVPTSDGQERDWRIFKFPITVGSEPPLLGGLAIDITEHERAVKMIREHDERTQSIVDSVIDGIITIDQGGLITTVNAAAERLFGYRADELIGRNVRVLMPEPYHSEHDAYLGNYLRTGVPRIIGIGREVTGRRKDGSTFPMDLAVSEFHLGGILYFTGIIRDSTDRKRAEEELRRAKEAAEEASQAKDRFLAVLSHELRTPLTPVLATISYVETLPALPPELREEIVTIRRNVELEARLIDDLLDVTRINQGKLELHWEVLDAHASLRAALEICQSEVEAKDLEVSLALRAKMHHVWADPARLQQVFWNLIKNAVKFTPQGGRICLRSEDVGEARVAFQVTDTGIGIEPELLPHIFNAFEQGERNVTRRYGGLGLGLTIVKMLMDMHGGTLTAASAGRDRGSTFTVELGTVPAPMGQPPKSALAPKEKEGALKILLVEDNLETLRAISKLLSAHGFVVQAATSVRAALQAAAEERFDLVVSDIGLPDGSGLEVRRYVRDCYGAKGIAFSGYGTDEDVRASKEAGFAHHLTKPLRLGVLLDVIKQTAL